MASEYPYLYRYTHGEAARQHETELWEKSFRENVCCARAIEKEIRQCADPNDPSYLPDDCIAPVLEQFGFKRVSYVLAHTVIRLVMRSGQKRSADGAAQSSIVP